MFVQYNQVIERMLSLAEDQARYEWLARAAPTELEELRAEHAGTLDVGAGSDIDPYVSCFVAMPFNDPRAAEIYEALCGYVEEASAQTLLASRPEFAAALQLIQQTPGRVHRCVDYGRSLGRGDPSPLPGVVH